MSFDNLVTEAQKHFPDLKVKYKDQSKFMKILGILLFFNKKFMTDYTTTIGSTVYYPSKINTDTKPISSSITFLHELIHINDSKKLNKILFSFLYLTPQIFALFCLPLFFILQWWIVLILMAVFLSPLPSYFRMNYEKRAYLAGLYVAYNMSNMLKFKFLMATYKKMTLKQFSGASYYFMWPFSMEKEFDMAIAKVQNGERPYEDPIFEIFDKLIKVI